VLPRPARRELHRALDRLLDRFPDVEDRADEVIAALDEYGTQALRTVETVEGAVRLIRRALQ
jgi:hypothetical protein